MKKELVVQLGRYITLLVPSAHASAKTITATPNAGNPSRADEEIDQEELAGGGRRWHPGHERPENPYSAAAVGAATALIGPRGVQVPARSGHGSGRPAVEGCLEAHEGLRSCFRRLGKRSHVSTRPAAGGFFRWK